MTSATGDGGERAANYRAASIERKPALAHTAPSMVSQKNRRPCWPGRTVIKAIWQSRPAGPLTCAIATASFPVSAGEMVGDDEALHGCALHVDLVDVDQVVPARRPARSTRPLDVLRPTAKRPARDHRLRNALCRLALAWILDLLQRARLGRDVQCGPRPAPAPRNRPVQRCLRAACRRCELRPCGTRHHHPSRRRACT